MLIEMSEMLIEMSEMQQKLHTNNFKGIQAMKFNKQQN